MPAPTYTDTNLSNLVISKISQAKFNELREAGLLNENELYIVENETLDALGNVIQNVGTPVQNTDAANKAYVDGKTPAVATSSSAGIVKPDGTTITVDANGTISTPAVANLSTHTSNTDIHFSASERTKLSGIATGAQVNVLEGVKVGTTALTPTNKVVTVPLATSSAVGVVKPDGTTITVDGNGAISANGAEQVATDLTTHTSNTDIHFTANERTKLTGVESGAQVNVVEGIKIVDGTSLTPDSSKIVTIPVASSSQYGAVKVDNTSITISNGVISTPVASSLSSHTSNSDIHFTSAERTKLSGITSGAEPNVITGVKVGNTSLTPANKVVTIPTATTSALGVVKPDGTTITISDGVISASGGGGSSDITSEDITLNSRGYDTSSDFVFVTLTQAQKDAFYAENSAAAVNDYAITAVTESTHGGGQVTNLPAPRGPSEPSNPEPGGGTANKVYVGNYAVGDWTYSSDNNQILFAQYISTYSATAYSIWANGAVIGERSRLPGYILGTQSDKPLAPMDDVNTMSTKLSGIETGAQANVLEGIQVGSTQLVANNKVVTIPTATTSALGVVRPDGTTITILNGIITAVGGGSGGGGSSGSSAYTFNTPTQTTSTTDASNDTVSVQLADRAINIVPLTSGISYLNVTFPQPTVGYARDFFVRLTITGSVPSLSFSEYDNSLPSFDIADSAWAEVAQGVNIIMFTETSQS